MKSKLSKITSSIAIAVLGFGTLSSPAYASLPGFADRLDMTAGSFVLDATSAQMTLTISDRDGKIFDSSRTLSPGELKAGSPVLATCTSVPVSERLPMNGSGCTTYPFFSGVTPTVTGGGSSVTLTFTEVSPSWRASLPAVGVRIFFGVQVEDHLGESLRLILLSQSRAATETSVDPTSDPGVSFAGFLVSGASGRNFEAETAGTVTFTGKRLNQVTGATIGGIAVTVTSATRSTLVIDFDSLPEGKHDVVLTSKSGAKTTLRGFVTVN